VRELVTVAASRLGPGTAPVPETLLMTPRPGEPQMLLVACPIPQNQEHFRGPWPGAAIAVYVSSLADAGLLNHEVLMSLYGLTPAEARLAAALSRGHDLNTLGAEWGTSVKTLRTHLKRIFSKTGTSRQAELVHLLAGRPWNLTLLDPQLKETS
jgi:DNA-binding CsgD family transcriptional regulator